MTPRGCCDLKAVCGYQPKTRNVTIFTTFELDCWRSEHCIAVHSAGTLRMHNRPLDWMGEADRTAYTARSSRRITTTHTELKEPLHLDVFISPR